MCAIIDADVVHEAFGDKRTEAGTEFRKWVDRGESQLVLGGKLLEELDENSTFKRWRAVAAQFGRVQQLDETTVKGRTA